MNEAWRRALQADPGRRDRETALVDAVRSVLDGGEPPWDDLDTPDLRRRAGYLADVAQMIRGRAYAERAHLDNVRAGLGDPPAATFWPGEPPLPAGTDPVAERWGYQRGVNVLRLKSALKGRNRLVAG